MGESGISKRGFELEERKPSLIVHGIRYSFFLPINLARNISYQNSFFFRSRCDCIIASMIFLLLNGVGILFTGLPPIFMGCHRGQQEIGKDFQGLDPVL